MPELYIITGSNGAGKSTIGPSYLPSHIQDSCIVFDGDKLFIQKRNELWKTIKAPKEVAKLALQYTIDLFEKESSDALIQQKDYAYEGHFINDSTWDTPRKFKEKGYTVNLIFFGLKDPDASQLRVVERAREGGHWVDRVTIEHNFYGNLEKLEKHIDAINNIQIIDTTEQHTVLASFTDGKIVSSVSPSELPEWFVRHLPLLTEKVVESERNAPL